MSADEASDHLMLWTPLNIILFNLVFSDFSVSVLGNPFTLISALFHRWIFGKTMCVLYGFFMALLVSRHTSSVAAPPTSQRRTEFSNITERFLKVEEKTISNQLEEFTNIKCADLASI
ncbi:unnamed protein product [Spodoptera exigua]|nr:unnamed protein product [Spodoptera exigua]